MLEMFAFSNQASYNANQGSNRFTAHAKVLTEVALNFLSNQVKFIQFIQNFEFQIICKLLNLEVLSRITNGIALTYYVLKSQVKNDLRPTHNRTR